MNCEFLVLTPKNKLLNLFYGFPARASLSRPTKIK